MGSNPIARRSFIKKATQTLLSAPTVATLNNLAFAEQSSKPKPAPQTAPKSANLTLNVRDYGATGDGATKDTGDEGIPAIKNFRFTNIKVTDVPTLVDGTGIHPHKPLEGFTLANITGTCAKGIFLANIKDVDIRDLKVTGFTGPLLNISNVTGKGLTGATQIDPPKLPEPIPVPAQPYKLH